MIGLVKNETFATTSDGVSIRCLDFGGDGEPLLLAHATSFAGEIFAPWIETLAHSYHVFALDFRGHGGSEKPPPPYTWDGFSLDIIAATTALGVTDVLGVGHSAGAAALVGAQHLNGAFRQLVLLDPTLPAEKWRDTWFKNSLPMVEAARRRRSVWDSPQLFIDRMRRPTSPLAALRPEFLEAYAKCGLEKTSQGYELRCPPEVEAAIYRADFELDFYETCIGLEIPTTFVCGRDSYVRWPKEIIPHPTEMVDGGHFFPMQNPDQTLKAIRQCLDSQPAL